MGAVPGFARVRSEMGRQGEGRVHASSGRACRLGERGGGGLPTSDEGGGRIEIVADAVELMYTIQAS